MISLDDGARQMAGAWKLAFGAPDWRQSLDRSIDAVFSSFYAFLYAAPIVVLFSITARRAAFRLPDAADTLYREAPLAILIIGDLVIFALGWATSLALLVLIARSAGEGRRAADLIVGYNWLSPLIAAAQLPAVALLAATADRTIGAFATLPALALSITLIWGLVRRSLEMRIGPAAAIVFMLLLVGGLVEILGLGVLRAALDVQS